MRHPAYTPEQNVQETQATLAMEGMELSKDEVRMLTDYNEGKVSGDNLRRRILDSVTEK